MDKVFKALGDPTRRGILRLLRSGDMSAGEISTRFPIAKSTLSGHLNVLKEADLVVTERRGSTIVYSLHVAAYEEMVGAVMEILGVGEEPAPRGRRAGDARELAD
jgi:DNA-binding transcriptional ArsR family regulator